MTHSRRSGRPETQPSDDSEGRRHWTARQYSRACRPPWREEGSESSSHSGLQKMCAFRTSISNWACAAQVDAQSRAIELTARMAVMSDHTGPKSAYELAMERLRKQDAEAGVERQVVTAAQKAAVAEIRNFYEAKLAELDVSYQGRLRSIFDPERRAVVEEEYRRDRERLTSERDRKVETARSSNEP